MMAGQVSLDDRSRRTETVSPQRDERDSASSVNNDGNDIDMNGETDDEDMEDGDTRFDDGSAQVRNIRDPGQPTAREYKEHMTTHRPYRSWYQFCMMGRGMSQPHRKSGAKMDLGRGAPCVAGVRIPSRERV